MILTGPLHTVCSKYARRFAMQNVRFQPAGCGPLAGPCLVATDGRMLAVVSVDTADEPETPKTPVLVPQEAVEAAWKSRNKSPRKDAVLALNGAARAPYAAGAPSWAYAEGEFPRVEAVIPAKRAGAVRIGLNAEYLLRLAQALGSEYVELEIGTAEQPIVVRVGEKYGGIKNDRLGVLMPITFGKPEVQP